MTAASLTGILLHWLPRALTAGAATAILLGGIAFLMSLVAG